MAQKVIGGGMFSEKILETGDSSRDPRTRTGKI